MVTGTFDDDDDSDELVEEDEEVVFDEATGEWLLALDGVSPP